MPHLTSDGIEQCLRPSIRFLSPTLIRRIVAEARTLLNDLGVLVENDRVVDLLVAAGARKDPSNGRVMFTDALMDAALKNARPSFSLYDRDGSEVAQLGEDRVHYTPGSAAIHLLDRGAIRKAVTRDYVRYARLVDRLDEINYQSTAVVTSDVHENVSDGYRLYLSLLYGRKPVVTGAFTIAGLQLMIDLLLTVRGSREALAAKPLGMFSCCPTAPLKWSDVTSQNVVDCAGYGIPVEYISMPLTGFVAPGTLVGTLVQHTAETLSGLVISQTAAPGTPVLWGGSPAAFDYRYETTPMGAIETQMICCSYSEIGKHLGLPTQAYIGLSDSMDLDAQAGLETMSGLLLASLAGINSVSGPGMLDFESCQSLEKLVLDNEMCGMVRRLLRGVEPRDGDFPSTPHFEELIHEGHLLIADHTRRWLRHEVRLPGPVINRANRPRYQREGAVSLPERARLQVERLLGKAAQVIEPERYGQLEQIMLRGARAVGMDRLPAHE